MQYINMTFTSDLELFTIVQFLFISRLVRASLGEYPDLTEWVSESEPGHSDEMDIPD